ncbi:hypothetical protein DFS34DRAFT_190748 [Phlyctochytrium arcticum]|nr:hypothetical protein DFS34DRAFT_449013 [Phlyctochytrium arcticum]KAI9095244.1 hypothetical protein DFS34DRAFT_190748 [Phlyctochytrium arcticum]
MQPTIRLLNSAIPRSQLTTLTLLTRQYCGLCEEAKSVLIRAQQKTPFTLNEQDIDAPQNKSWLKLYMFDVPVVLKGTDVMGMHRIQEEEVSSWVNEKSETK